MTAAATNDSYPALLADCRSIDPEPIADLTLDLCRIWSPPGHEATMAERMADELSAVGATVRLDHEYPNSPSVIAEIGSGSGRTLQWHGHLDAVDVPHESPHRDGHLLVGRGTADMKGPDAAMVTAARLLVRHGVPDGCKVLITLHGMHESGGNEPLHALIARGIHGDAAITGELGGGRELPTAGLGLTFWDITVTKSGSPSHEVMATPDTVDPVEVGRLLHGELAALRDRLAAEPGEAPTPSLFIGRFAGGDYINRIPVRAQLQGTRRHDLSMTQQDVADELQRLVDGVAHRTGANIELSAIPVADSFEVAPEERIVAATLDAHRDLTGQTIPLSRSKLATNAVHFVREAGIPAVGYGPDPSTNHSDYEVVEVADLARIAGGFALATAQFFGMPDAGSAADG